MKLALVTVAAVGLAGCGDPEIKACEVFVKEGLASPSSYSQINVVTFTDALSYEMLRDATGSKGNAALENALKLSATDPGVRTVLLEYDADNRVGATLRESAVCHFAMTDVANEKFYREDDLSGLAERAASQNDFRVLLPGLGHESKPPVGCCLDWNFNPLDLPSGTEADAAADAEARAEVETPE